MVNDVLFALIPLLIIAAVLLYIIVTQKRNFEQLHNELEGLSNNLKELSIQVQNSREVKSEKREKIKMYSSKELDNRKVKVLDKNDFDFKVKANNKGIIKNNFPKEKSNNEEIDFGEKYVFNHFTNSLTERNKEVEVVRKLK